MTDSSSLPYQKKIPRFYKKFHSNQNSALYSFSQDDYKLSLMTLMELGRSAEYATLAQQIIIEDAATCFLLKLLDYVNTNVLKNFELYLQQERCPRTKLITSKIAETGWNCDISSMRVGT